MKQPRKIQLMVLATIILFLGLWLSWDIHNAVACNQERNTLFPLPFRIAYLPIWFAKDLSILLILLGFILSVLLNWDNGNTTSSMK